jgi:transposase
VLACAQGRPNTAVAAEPGCDRVTVAKWRHRFAADRLEGLADAPRPGAVRTIGDDVVQAIVVETPETAPVDATHWSTRALAARHGISRQTVSEIWRAFGLKPWRQDEFKVSPDPDLVEKIRDIVGLYLNPPVAAAVFAVDEKPQIQALDRSAPILPMLPTTPQRATHDYERNGTIDLFAALEVATGKVITQLRPSHQRGVRRVLEQDQPRGPRRPRCPRCARQPVHPQDPGRARVAAAAQAVPLPLHPDLRIVDEPGRAVVLRAHHQEAATLSPPHRQRPRRRYSQLGLDLERQPQTVHLAQVRRRHPATPRRLLHSNQPKCDLFNPDRTLDPVSKSGWLLSWGDCPVRVMIADDQGCDLRSER